MTGKDANNENDPIFSEEEMTQFREEAMQGFREQSKLTPESSATVSNSKNPKGVLLGDGSLVSSQIFRTGIGRRRE
jgi:hypothetical protein